MKKNIPPSTHFIITGGTIDSFYDGTKDTVIPAEKTVLPNYLNGLKLYSKCIFSEICMKDSRHLDDKDLKKILHTIEKSKYTKIIITHGTYTMSDTARYLKANLKRKDQCIVLTGAMTPMIGFTNSDGPFNLGFSMACLSVLENGIFVCMNGRVFSPEEVLKSLYKGRLSSIYGER